MVNAEKWGAKMRKWGDANLLLAITCVASLVFLPFSVFKVLYHEHPFAFSPSSMSVMP